MKILVDADACPVTRIVEKIAKYVKEYYKPDKDSSWDVVGIFIVSEPLLSNEVYHKGLNIISKAELSVEKIRSVRK